jgi:putative membrane protein
MGGLYGATSELSSKIRMAGGVPYGVAVFLGADELALPALKLAKGAAEYPISTHLYGLTSHIIWATTTDAVRRLVRKIL